MQFAFRNPWNKPFADYEYISDLESQIAELKKHGKKIQQQLQQSINSASQSQTVSRINLLKSENKKLLDHIQFLEEEIQKLINGTKNKTEKW